MSTNLQTHIIYKILHSTPKFKHSSTSTLVQNFYKSTRLFSQLLNFNIFHSQIYKYTNIQINKTIQPVTKFQHFSQPNIQSITLSLIWMGQARGGIFMELCSKNVIIQAFLPDSQQIHTFFSKNGPIKGLDSRKSMILASFLLPPSPHTQWSTRPYQEKNMTPFFSP